ncbi:MAG: CoA pyrophosphatase [Idiomarina sp.]|nr:CoA pyrophosphatase [Idiomarina sp.]
MFDRASFLRQFQLSTPTPVEWPNHTWRPSAVLVALRETHQGLEFVLTRRTAHMRHHAHQVCFPGGREDEEDTSLVQTAIREAHEELGIPESAIEVIGQLPPQPVLTRFMIQPFVGFVDPRVNFELQATEVAEVLCVPAAYALNQANHLQFRRDHSVYPIVHFIPWQGQLIWGATAAIIRRLADQMNPQSKSLYRPVF